jgi:hypothetical protein
VTTDTDASSEATGLAIVQCSIAGTRRRRFHWAAWWSTPPCRHPFAKPDAHGGGARSFEQARADAEEAIGRSITIIEPHWARAWSRVMQGERPWGRMPKTSKAPEASTPLAASTPWWQVLGVPRRSTLVEARRAYRQLVLVHHPDRGGDGDTFRRIHLAYQSACRALERPRG